MIEGYTLVWNFYCLWDVPGNLMNGQFSVNEDLYLIGFLATGWSNYLGGYLMMNFDYLENEVWSRHCSIS